MTDPIERCELCRFWIRRGSKFGTCQRAQPYPRLQISIRTQPAYDNRQFEANVSGYHAPQAEWPTTDQDEWCGEFKAGKQHA